MRSVVISILLVLRRLLALVGAVVALGYGGISIIRSLNRAGDLPTIRLYPSPDGRMMAETIRREGGHFLAPYCSDTVAILPISYSPAHALDDRYTVFTGDCSRGGPAVEWKTSRNLQVNFQIDWSAEGRTDAFSLTNQDRSKSVRVSFSGREP